MQSFWDLMPASLWPTQSFIPTDAQALAALAQGGGYLPAPLSAARSVTNLARADASTPGVSSDANVDITSGPPAGARRPTSFWDLLPPPPPGQPFVPMLPMPGQLDPRLANAAAAAVAPRFAPILPSQTIGNQPRPDSGAPGGILGASVGELTQDEPSSPQVQLTGAANDNNPRDAQCTTASYDCLGHATNPTYIKACNDAYLWCQYAGGVAGARGVYSLVRFPHGGSVILYPDGNSQYIPAPGKGIGD
jgi:hypothetical protein